MEKEYDEVQMMKEKKPNTETSVLTSEEREKIIENATTVGDNFAWEEGVEVARKVFINSLIWHTEQAVLAKCRAEMDALRKEKILMIERIKELEQERERMLSTETVQKIVRAFWDSQESGDERPSTLLIKVHEILKGE